MRLDTRMDAVEDVKSRLDVADVVGEYLQLKTAGSGAFKALCPFHNEKTPSFYISRPRQTWHCFGCDQGGDIISFVMQIEGMEFREALEHLAQKAGVQLPAFDSQRSSQKKRIHEVNEIAMKFFQASLNTLPQAEHARVYVKRRGVDELTADLFRIGYAPDSWDSLTKALIEKGITAEELLLAGVVGKGEREPGVYDRFRNRLMFPIADVHGNIVGFTGRILENAEGKPQDPQANSEAKYVNTPETPAYRKSAVLYGLDKAKADIRRQDLAVIVEGNMDVVGSHQYGVTNVVAASGTALTSEQLALLKRFTTNLAIAFDQDKAGAAATLRGLDLARAQDFNIKIISLPAEAGKDPDEAVRKDPQIWKDAITGAANIVDWIYRNAFETQKSKLKTQNLGQAEEKKEIARMILPELRRIADAVERDHWVKKLATDLNVSEEALKESMQQQASSQQRVTNNKQPAVAPQSKIQIVKRGGEVPGLEMERRVLACAISRQEVFGLAVGLNGLNEQDFVDENLRGLYAMLRNAHNTVEIASPDRAELGTTLRPPSSLGPDQTNNFNALAFLAEREFQGMTLDELKRELNTGIEQLRRKRKTRELELLKQQMAEAELLKDEQRIKELTQRFQELT